MVRRPARQLKGCHGACVADHGVAHQRAQALGIGRLARLARRHVGGAELLERLEDARLQQRQQIVELGQVVLHRRRREQQQEALVQGVDQLPALAGAVAQVVRLVDDDQVEAAGEQALGMLAPARRAPARRSGGAGPRTRCGIARAATGRGWSRRRCRTWLSSSSRHCPTSEAGTSTSTLSAMPRSRYSLSTIPASMVLPRPTSSASSTRPRNCLSTLRTVST